MGSMLSNYVSYEEEYLEAAIRHILEDGDLLDGALSDLAFVEMNAYGHKVNRTFYRGGCEGVCG